MKFTLFRKQLLLTAGVTLAFIALGMLAFFLVIEAERNSDRNRLRQGPGSFTARMIDELTHHEGLSPEAALEAIKRSHPDDMHFEVFDADKVPKALIGDNTLPGQPYETLWLHRDRLGPPAGEIVRLDSTPPTYLVVSMGGSPGAGSGHAPNGLRHPPPHGPLGPLGMFYMNFIVLAISVLLGAAVSVFLLFRSMGAKAKLVDQILTEMRGGNLKARFPVKRLDEVGQFMQKFNTMADEIEHLVERLKGTELRRTRLLQELAHDLRTPVASLKNFVETLSHRAGALSVEHRDQMLSFSLKEIDYLERLVEDLLFLAQVTEPNYLTSMGQVPLADIADEELDRVSARFQAGQRRISVRRSYPSEEISVKGDPHLLRRMLRNGLENAFAFAKSEVNLTVSVTYDKVEVSISDDGPGLSREALAAYGEKRTTRVINETPGGRLSVGLGSVIMKTVAQTHGGSLDVRNVPGAGAHVQIVLPSAAAFPA